MVDVLIESPILLLVLIGGLGFGLGRISFLGIRLGPAAILFTGLLFGGLSNEFHIPEIIILLGLAIFLYSLGLSNGPAFFQNLQKSGKRDIFFILLMNTLSLLLAFGVYYLFQFNQGEISGMLAGSGTNTAALAGFLDMVRSRASELLDYQATAQDGVIGYSLTYPMGVMASIMAIIVMEKLIRIDYKKEERSLSSEYPVKQSVNSVALRINNPEVCGFNIRDLKRLHKLKIVFGRLKRGDAIDLVHFDTRFQLGDEVSIVGDAEELERVQPLFGEVLPYSLSDNRAEYDTRRVFVSNPNIAGEKLASLNLNERFAAIVTRVMRGDLDILANNNTILELGDRVRVVAKRSDIKAIKSFFGDSYESLATINLFSFGIGLALGLLLGMITFELPGGVSFRLGYAGGPLIVGLLLGNMRKTGNIVWSLPYGANITLRQVGLMFLLAGIGVNSGHTFMETILTEKGLVIFLGGTIISICTAVFSLWIGYKLFKIPFSILCGIVSNQPAILDYAVSKTGNKLPYVGFILMLPISSVMKIIYVQLIFAILS